MNRVTFIIIFSWSLIGFGAEPLKGPEFAYTGWRRNFARAEAVDDSKKNTRAVTTIQRRLSADIPIPLALWVVMPFASLDHEDLVVDGKYLVDQRAGIGVLHHAAEGDPAWRIEVQRLGVWTTRPTVRSRAIFNLVKHFPSLRLRPSDTTFAWLGLNSLTLTNGQTMFIPELAWTRDGPDGLSVDLNVPQHFFLGYKGPLFGLTIGIEQRLRLLQESIGRTVLDPILARQARLKLIFNLQTGNSGAFLIGASLLEELESMRISSDKKTVIPSNRSLGSELSLSWIPNA